jgi:DNA-binding transcriptional MerR regulator
MSNLARQNSAFEQNSSYSSKATPVAPQGDDKAPKKAQGAFRTISEVADELDVPQHVLRFWETKFSQIKPLKRGGGRRYYRPEDVALLKHIHFLLYTEGYTIKGVQKLLKGQGKNQIAAQVFEAEEKAFSAPVSAKIEANDAEAADVSVPTGKVYNLNDRQRGALEDMLSELKALRALFPENA